MNSNYQDFIYIFHSTKQHYQLIQNHIKSRDIKNYEIISDEKIKSHTLKKSIFAVVKSGTVSLEICKSKIPSIILYKMNFLNYFIVRTLVKVKFANIINITANEEIIPELLRSKCNAKNIFENVNYLLSNPNKMKEQINKSQLILKKLKSPIPSAECASKILIKYL